jgi:putative glutamine amidotransferase
MTAAPLVGIPMQTMAAIPGATPDCWVVGQRYVEAVVAVGGTPWLIPLLADDEELLRRIHDRLDGLLLAGGPDVDPSHYGEDRKPSCGRSDPVRDCVEITLTRWALADHKPVLGLCRGLQALNVALGGTLHQDLATERPGTLRHDCSTAAEGFQRDALVHEVRVERGTRLAEILQTDRVPVNSLHHQGIEKLASSLKATAFAPDGLIEGVEGTDSGFLLGVQWHPEELAATYASHRRLFEAFVSAASARRA